MQALSVPTPNRTPCPWQSACGRTTTVLKAEIWANDALRRDVLSLCVQPADSTTMRILPVVWGGVGDNTLKVVPLNWTRSQADGGKICMEMVRSSDLFQFCNSVQSGRAVPSCW